MQRRDFIKSMAAAGAIAAVGRRAHAAPKGWREFEITFRISIKDPAAPVRLWVPVPQDALDYQRVVDIGWRSPVTAHVLWEGTSRAPIVSTAWPDLTTAREVEITARVMTRDRSGFYSDASREELAEYLRPTPSSPTDGIVLAKAREIVAARTVPTRRERSPTGSSTMRFAGPRRGVGFNYLHSTGSCVPWPVSDFKFLSICHKVV
jgi:hypothetical protein